MMSSMRQWRRMVLMAMLAWVLLFLPLTSAGSLLSPHPDVRRLASIQAAITGFRPGPVTVTAPYQGEQSKPEPSKSYPTPESSVEGTHSPNSAPYRSQEVSQQDYLDPQSLAAWSSFGTENIDEPGAHSRERTSQQNTDYQNNVSNAVEEDEELSNKRRTTAGRRSGADSRDVEEYYFSKSYSVVQRLWRGKVSSGMLSPRLQRAMKDYLSANKHHVVYKGHRTPAQSRKSCCARSRGALQLSGWGGLVPSLPLQQLYTRNGPGLFKTCAVVTSAGAILHSGLGREIDTHDAVLRFNAAPTDGYERDVGNRTTIRIINSQILTNPRHRFNTSSIYKNVTLVAWDPAPYTLNLHKWYTSPDYNLFGPYVEHRKRHPDQPFYILHPGFVWRLWDVIQSNTQENIQPNPPSSGFIGILLMMALCEQVHVYEYIPSMRQTDLCHYHERYYDSACTLGAYHPLLYEKSLIQRLNMGPESDLRKKGRVTLPGLSTVDCDA
uniref:Beta-galactoside alpha-2,6-sialyltransferase 2 n=1 Tax=Neogobius melanostomus TaxID=47308 RepID=A0A8C6WUI1_9GOBI